MGFAGDRMKRTHLLALGVGVWSIATVGSGFAATYGQLCVAQGVPRHRRGDLRRDRSDDFDGLVHT